MSIKIEILVELWLFIIKVEIPVKLWLFIQVLNPCCKIISHCELLFSGMECMIKVIKRPHTYLILNMFKNVLATRLVRYIVLNLMRENLTFYLSECNYVLLLYFDVEFQLIKFVEWLAVDLWVFSRDTQVFSTNKTDRHDMAEMLSKWC
jgi:hypothetical protein